MLGTAGTSAESNVLGKASFYGFCERHNLIVLLVNRIIGVFGVIGVFGIIGIFGVLGVVDVIRVFRVLGVFGIWERSDLFDQDSFALDYLLDAHLRSGWNSFVAKGLELVGGAVERDGDLAGLLAVGGYAEIDVGGQSDDLFDAERVVAVELHHLEEQEGDERHEDETHNGCEQSKQDVVGDIVPAEHARPAEAQDEADDRLDRDEVETGGIEGSVATVGYLVGCVGHIDITVGIEADEGHDGLDDEDDTRDSCQDPINLQHAIQ